MEANAGHREELFDLLDERVGTRTAALLMAELPPAGWREFATKSDIDALRTATKSDIDALRTATKSDIDALRTATKSDIDALRTELAAVEGRLEGKIGSQTRTTVVTHLGSMLGVAMLVLAAVRFA